jgi:hypothetical protein
LQHTSVSIPEPFSSNHLHIKLSISHSPNRNFSLPPYAVENFNIVNYPACQIAFNEAVQCIFPASEDNVSTANQITSDMCTPIATFSPKKVLSHHDVAVWNTVIAEVLQIC